MELTIKERTITLKFGMRAMMAFERIAKKSFEVVDMVDVVTLFFCCVITSDRDISITWDEFVDFIDEQPKVLSDFSEWYVSIMLRSDMLSDSDKPSDEQVKKARSSKKKR